MKFQVLKTKTGWYWRIVARNGKVLCHSETYTTKRKAMHALDIVTGGAALAIVEFVQ